MKTLTVILEVRNGNVENISIPENIQVIVKNYDKNTTTWLDAPIEILS